MKKGLGAGGWGLAGALAVALAPIALAGRPAGASEPAVDAVFARWTTSTPGCAVGVATDGTPVLTKGYGMADLEHDVPIGADTIFEAGSVSKQFTAAAVLLLARDGKLSLDDPAHKYIPELREYAQTAESGLTIRHMLSHTSGLRDWGSVAGISGWPRTSRAYTHAHVLEIVSRQHALNFTPGTRWSYSNTGFNLAAIIVERVSGLSFQEFTRTRLFQPLGMTSTSWRDDYTGIVKRRAQAYRERDGAFHTDMPFENVYGNGGLLTTVGDLLKWNAHYDAPAAADAALIAAQQMPGHFNGGRPYGYGLGLYVGQYKGLREVFHSGSTAGYQAFLTRFPEQRVSVAVLCNAASAPRAVADLYLGDRLKPSEVKATYTLSAAETDRFVGQWIGETGVPTTIAKDDDGLRLGRTTRLFAISPLALSTAEHERWELDAYGVRYTDPFGRLEELRKEGTIDTIKDPVMYAGTYVSDDAETTLTASVIDGQLVLKRRPDTIIALTRLYPGAFSADHGLGTVIFHWDASGRPSELSVVQDRVWDMRFQRVRN
jgi:CubicO group peptidase (beta-lactamase class C family)